MSNVKAIRQRAAALREARENEKLREKEMNEEILNYLNNGKLRKQVFKGKLAKQTNVKFKTNVAKRTSSQSYYTGQPNLRSAPPNTSNTMYKWWLDEWDEFLDNQGVGKKYEGGKKYQRRTKRKTKRRRKTRKRRRKRTKRRRNK